MNLFTRLRESIFGPTLRNKRGGLAWIKPHCEGTGTENIFGHIVKTVSFDGSHWTLDPEPCYTAKCDLRDWSGRFIPAGTLVEVVGMLDEFLEPIPDAGITDAEVRELYLSRPVKAKEPA